MGTREDVEMLERELCDWTLYAQKIEEIREKLVAQTVHHDVIKEIKREQLAELEKLVGSDKMRRLTTECRIKRLRKSLGMSPLAKSQPIVKPSTSHEQGQSQAGCDQDHYPLDGESCSSDEQLPPDDESSSSDEQRPSEDESSSGDENKSPSENENESCEEEEQSPPEPQSSEEEEQDSPAPGSSTGEDQVPREPFSEEDQVVAIETWNSDPSGTLNDNQMELSEETSESESDEPIKVKAVKKKPCYATKIGSNANKFPCTRCNVTFRNFSLRRIHMRQKHKVKDDKFVVGCTDCGTQFPNRTAHVQHRINIHGSRYNRKGERTLKNKCGVAQ